MKLKKIFVGLISLAAAMTVSLTVSIGASADWDTKAKEKLDPGLSISSGNWLAQIYNVGSTDGDIPAIDYGLDLSKVAGVRAVFTVNEDPDLGYLAFEGAVGGCIGISTTITGVDIDTELYYKYSWSSNYWWGMEYTTPDGEIINSDFNADNDPNNDNPVSAKRIGKYTYELVTDYVNPFTEDGVKSVDCMQVFIQQWSDSLNLYTVNYVEILDNKGNVMLTFDEYGHASKEVASDPPTSVSGLRLKARTSDAMRLSWNRNPLADGYIIERKDGNKWTRVVKITKNSTTEYRISKLKAGTTYNFRVRAYKMNGKTALYSGYKTISASTKLSAVSGLKLKGRAGSALRLAWNKNTGADGYIIEMKSGSTWTRVAKITKNSTVEFRKDKLKAGTSYNFRICAYKIDGKTARYSGYTSITAATYPSAVSGLKLKNANSTAVRLAWTKNTSADGYIIEQKSGNKWVRVGKITKNSTVEFRKGGLKSKTSYTFRVTSYKIDGKTALYGAGKTITVKTK